MNDTKTVPGASQVMPVGDTSGLHHIIIVGGGAGGLELATRLGDKLGKTGKASISLVDRARTHMWKPLLHEIAAGSMDVASTRPNIRPRASGTDSVPLRRDDRDRPQEQAVFLAATYDEDGREIMPARSLVRHARHRDRLRQQRVQYAGRDGARHHPRHARGGRALPPAPRQRLRARVCEKCAIRPGSCTWRSSAPERRAPSLPPSCI